jgi:hypothetical protein
MATAKLVTYFLAYDKKKTVAIIVWTSEAASRASLRLIQAR